MALRKAMSVDCLPTAQVKAVLYQQILSQWLGQNISDLVFGTHRKNLDETETYVLTKVMITHVDVFGAWTKLGESGQFECARVILENFAIYDRFVAYNFVLTLPHFR